ncbi:MAG: thermonuclease family protein [Alphaproteobacteria bacterium]|nr:thermonuclease family protein [Alphaproteobacteria bacterium]
MFKMLIRMFVLMAIMAGSYVSSTKFKSTDPSVIFSGMGSLCVCGLILFLFTRKMWRHIGFFKALGIVVFLLIAMVFVVSGGSMARNITNAVLGVFGKSTAQTSQQVAPTQQQLPSPGQEGQQVQQQPQEQAPVVINGYVSLIKGGDHFIMNGLPFRIFGIVSPDISQICQNAQGRDYPCGKMSAMRLKEFIGGDEVSCTVMAQSNSGELQSRCSIKNNDLTMDIGAAMVQAGWAVALVSHTQVYIPYQQMAQNNRAGLWNGTFMMPWEWQVHQMNIKKGLANVKVPTVKVKKERKSSGKSIFDHF